MKNRHWMIGGLVSLFITVPLAIWAFTCINSDPGRACDMLGIKFLFLFPPVHVITFLIGAVVGDIYARIRDNG